VWEGATSAATGEDKGHTKLGVVTGVSAAGTPVLEVETAEGEVLIPLATEICRRIDVAARRIDVMMPEGLRDLNRRDSGKKKI